MSNKIPFEYYENLDAVIDYIETCTSENRDINGDSMVLFSNVTELVETYLDEVIYTLEQLKTIVSAAAQNAVIVAACQSIE
jgi:primosomal protein N''